MKLIYILYDGIKNSVFEGQVWNPTVKRAQKDPNLEITIISLERKITTHNYKHPQIKIIQIWRPPFIGKYGLWLNFWQIKKLIPSEKYTLMARGPFAGWLAQKVANQFCSKVLLQARGVATEEYEYTNSDNLNWWRKFRMSQLRALENSAYKINSNQNITIEAVSEGLKEHLVKNYQSPINKITIAAADIPPKFSAQQINTWRVAKRTELTIDSSETVYCFAGSVHKWQCPEKTVGYFKKEFTKNPNSSLLIFTDCIAQYTQLLEQADIPSKNYRVMKVAHKDIYQYLSAADYGIILRKPHTVSWVSRPTKVLEYKSAGLKIIHNNTVKWIIDQKI